MFIIPPCAAAPRVEVQRNHAAPRLGGGPRWKARRRAAAMVDDDDRNVADDDDDGI